MRVRGHHLRRSHGGVLASDHHLLCSCLWGPRALSSFIVSSLSPALRLPLVSLSISLSFELYSHLSALNLASSPSLPLSFSLLPSPLLCTLRLSFPALLLASCLLLVV